MQPCSTILITFNAKQTLFSCFYFLYFSLFGISVAIGSCAVGLKICALTAGIKKCQSVVKKNKKETL